MRVKGEEQMNMEDMKTKNGDMKPKRVMKRNW